MVECNLAKVDVAGSNPVSRSIFVFDGMGVTARVCGSGPLAQLVEQVTLNHKVVGSTPTRRTTFQPLIINRSTCFLSIVFKS